MLLVLSLYFLIVWLVFYKFRVRKFTTGWKALVYTIALIIAWAVLAQLAEWSPVVSGGMTARTAQVAPEVSGRVTAVNVGPNARVQAGDTLFTMDPEIYRNTVDQLEAALDLLRLRYDQTERLVRSGAARAFDLESLDSEIRQLEAQLGTARRNLRNTAVVAPSDGIVPSVALTEGEFVGAGRSVMAFIDTSQWVFLAEVKQNALRRLAPGTPVRLSFDAMPGQVFEFPVMDVPSGIGEGQMTPSGSAISAPRQRPDGYIVRLTPPEDFPTDQLLMGLTASGRAFPEDMPAPWKILGSVLFAFSLIGQYL
jgi:multidrug resistance efflux pump